MPLPEERSEFEAGQHAIGAILVKAGTLTQDEVATILRKQREKGALFGDNGKALGLLRQSDIDFALSRQFDHPYLQRGASKVSQTVVAAYDPSTPQVEALRALRSELMLRWFDGAPAHKSLAVVSEAPKEGRSYIAANLAVVFSQLGARTLLIDADLRNPCQHGLFGLDNRIGLSALLSGRAGADAVQRVPGLESLSVLPAGVLPPNPQELLSRATFGHVLGELALHLDFILLDTPPGTESADAQTIASRAGAALVVVRKNASRMWRVHDVAESIARANAAVVGAVLNDF